MHDRLVRFVLKVAVPTAPEVWSRPRIHLIQLLLGWSNFDTSFDAICSKWAGALKVPLIEHGFLDFRNTTNEVIKTLGIYYC